MAALPGSHPNSSPICREGSGLDVSDGAEAIILGYLIAFLWGRARLLAHLSRIAKIRGFFRKFVRWSCRFVDLFVGTFVCVHKEESWTHQTKHFTSESREQRSGAERSGCDERSWKRRSCRKPRYREWRDDTTSTRIRCSTGESRIAKAAREQCGHAACSSEGWERSICRGGEG